MCFCLLYYIQLAGWVFSKYVLSPGIYLYGVERVAIFLNSTVDVISSIEVSMFFVIWQTSVILNKTGLPWVC